MSYPKIKLSKKTRIGINIFLISLFFIISPTVILYTTGYRYDFKEKIIKQTGVISVDVEPETAKVFLNDVFINKKIPIRLANRAPGIYNVKITAEGYHSWEKDIVVESKQTTFIKNIALFKKTNPQKIEEISQNIVKAKPSNDGEFLLLTVFKEDIYETILYEITTGKTTTITRSGNKTEPQAEWSPFGNFAFVILEKNDKFEMRVITAENPENVQIKELATRPDGIQWKNNSTPVLVMNEDGKVRQISNFGEKEIGFALPDSAWFADSKDALWVFDKTDRKIENNVSGSNQIDIPKEHEVKKIIDLNNQRIILQTQQGILVKNINREGKTTALNANNIFYNKLAKEWLAWSQFELWTIYENGEITLLNRTGEKMKFARPMDRYGVLLIATENSLFGFNPGYYTALNLAKNVLANDVAVNAKNKFIIFSQNENNAVSIYKLDY